MKKLFCILSVFLLINICNLAAASNNQQTIDDSFKAVIKKHLDSYKIDPRERVYSITGLEADSMKPGWRKSKCLVTNNYSYDIQPTGFVNRPYTAHLIYKMYTIISNPYSTREEAESAETFRKYTAPDTYRITFRYQNGSWVPEKYETQFQILPFLPAFWLTMETVNSEAYQRVAVKN